MNIAGIFLNPEVRTGGHKRYLELLQAFADKGHKVFLILNESLDYLFIGINEIRIQYDYKKLFVPYSLVSLLKIKQNSKRISEQIVKCDYIVIFGETHLLAGSFLKKKFHAKLLFSLRSNGVVEAQVKRIEPGISYYRKLILMLSEYKYRYYEKYFGGKADLIVFQSSFDRDSFLSRRPIYHEKSVVIPGNIGGRRFDPKFKDTNKSEKLQTIIFLGALSVRKGIKYLFDAFIRLFQEGYNINLIIAGDGRLGQELEKRAMEECIQDRIIFLGKISNTFEVLAKADLLVVPSIFDSYPNVILESLYVGTPVIAARSGGMSDMIEASNIFEPSNEIEIYELISILYNNKSEYLKLKNRVSANRKKFNFDWSQMFLSHMMDD